MWHDSRHRAQTDHQIHPFCSSSNCWCRLCRNVSQIPWGRRNCSQFCDVCVSPLPRQVVCVGASKGCCDKSQGPYLAIVAGLVASTTEEWCSKLLPEAEFWNWFWLAQAQEIWVWLMYSKWFTASNDPLLWCTLPSNDYLAQAPQTYYVEDPKEMFNTSLAVALHDFQTDMIDPKMYWYIIHTSPTRVGVFFSPPDQERSGKTCLLLSLSIKISAWRGLVSEKFSIIGNSTSGKLVQTSHSVRIICHIREGKTGQNPLECALRPKTLKKPNSWGFGGNVRLSHIVPPKQKLSFKGLLWQEEQPPRITFSNLWWFCRDMSEVGVPYRRNFSHTGEIFAWMIYLEGPEYPKYVMHISYLKHSGIPKYWNILGNSLPVGQNYLKYSGSPQQGDMLCISDCIEYSQAYFR